MSKDQEIKTVVHSAKRNETLNSVFTDIGAYEACKKMPGNFPQNLVQHLDKRGSLSPEQNFWLHKLAMQSVATTDNSQNESAMSLPKIRKMFDLAVQQMKYPKIRFERSQFFDDVVRNFDEDNDSICLPESTIFMYRAGEKSKAPGVIHITNGAKYGSPDNKYFGKITVEGKFIPSRECSELLKQFLMSFDSDPSKIGRQYGKASGNCCFCHRPITTDVSKKHGYGPVCAKRFQLPYEGETNEHKSFLSMTIDEILEKSKELTPEQLAEWASHAEKEEN